MHLRDLKIDTDLELDVYQYRDCRSLLKDYFESCKREDKKYSFRHFTKRLGLNSPGYIQSILQGKKSISDRLLEQLIQLMGLRHNKRAYFELLVRMERVDFSSPLYQEYYEAAQSMRSKNLKITSIDEAQCNCISSWYHWVVREMTMLKGATLNIQWFKKCLNRFIPLSTKQVIGIIEDLKTAELLVEQDHEISTPDPIINFADDKISTVLKMYHKGTMEQGILSLGTKAKDREYGSVLIATTPEKCQIVKEKLRKMRREVLESLETPSGEATVLVSFSYQMFPAAQVEDKDAS